MTLLAMRFIFVEDDHFLRLLLVDSEKEMLGLCFDQSDALSMCGNSHYVSE